MDGDDRVVGQHAPAALLDPRAIAHTVFQTSMLASGTRNARETAGFSSGSSRSACAGSISSQSTPVSRQPLREPVGVRGVVERGGDEEPADVLDRVAARSLQDAVLGDALLGGARVLDRVAAARVQQSVEAPARPLGQVEAVHEHDVVAAQRRVPGHAGAGGATADHQYVGAERGHGVSLPVEGGPRWDRLQRYSPRSGSLASRPSRRSG